MTDLGKRILDKLDDHTETLAEIKADLRYVATREDVSTAIRIHTEGCPVKRPSKPSLVGRVRTAANGKAKLWAALAAALTTLAGAAAVWLAAH